MHCGIDLQHLIHIPEWLLFWFICWSRQSCSSGLCSSQPLSLCFITSCITASWKIEHRFTMMCYALYMLLFSLRDWAVKLPYTLLIQHDIAVVSKWYSQCTALDNWAILPPCGHVLNCLQLWCTLVTFLFHCIHLITTHSIWKILTTWLYLVYFWFRPMCMFCQLRFSAFHL